MRIPYTALPTATLRAIIEEFTTRDGTDHSPIGPRIDAVLAQLESRIVELHYDDETKSCNIMSEMGKHFTIELLTVNQRRLLELI